MLVLGEYSGVKFDVINFAGQRAFHAVAFEDIAVELNRSVLCNSQQFDRSESNGIAVRALQCDRLLGGNRFYNFRLNNSRKLVFNDGVRWRVSRHNG